MAEVYVSTDVEADGPISGPHSMLSFGSAAYLSDKTLDDAIGQGALFCNMLAESLGEESPLPDDF